jgi:hypothetical protein
MIDTDKYEGHTPIWNLWGETGAWWVQSDFTTHDDFVVAEVRSQNEVDARLIADAPLILAEVKRLREGINFALSYTRPTPHTDDPWMACREFIVEYLKELIE